MYMLYIMLPDWTPAQYLILLIFPIIRISQRSKHLSQYYNNTAKKNLFIMESSFQHQFTYFNPYTDVIWTKLNFWTFLSLPISIAFLSFSFSFTSCTLALCCRFFLLFLCRVFPCFLREDVSLARKDMNGKFV